jgi:hypothetical protein
VFKFTINGTSSGGWYFFLDESWGYAYSETDCSKKLAMAKFDSKLPWHHTDIIIKPELNSPG